MVYYGHLGIGNLLLKYSRGRLPRLLRVPSLTVLATLAAFLAGLIGAIIQDPSTAVYFVAYFLVIFCIMMTVLHRTKIAKTVFFYVDRVLTLHRTGIAEWLVGRIKNWTKQPVIFLADTDELHVLNKAILYVNRNEATQCLTIVHFYQDIRAIPPRLAMHRRVLDELYPKMTINLILVEGTLTPQSLDKLSEDLGVPKSLMFMSCPGETFAYSMGELGGVRIIML